MEHVKYIVVGAGPSGLAFAHTLRACGEESFLILEKEEIAGGLCRSEIVDATPLDIGGGHFLDIRRREVLDLLFQFMPQSEWQRYERISTIRIRGTEIEHPLEANLWQLPLSDQIDYLESIAEAGCVRGEPEPTSFRDWIVWKMGRRMAEDYMLPYNRKIWARDLNDLGTYWLDKLPNVSFRETLASCLEKKAGGSLPAHAIFLYPKAHGYGEVWDRMGKALGAKLRLGVDISEIDFKKKIVNRAYKADLIVNTIPWTIWDRVAQLPLEIRGAVKRLVYTSVDVDYNERTPSSKAHWIYEPDETISHHRILCRANFVANARGCWTETNALRSSSKHGWRHRNEYAYPVNTRDKPEAIRMIQDWAKLNSILSLGRWGTWEHMNSDVAVSLAIAAGQRAVRGE